MSNRASAHISSKVEDINGLVIRGVPYKPVAVTKAVRIENTIVMVGADGTLYSSSLRTPGAYHYRDGEGGHLDTAFRGLQRLGALSKEAVAQHKALTDRIAAEKKKRWAAQDILRGAQVAGLALTAAQRRKLEAAAAEEGGAA